jgi:hypothetical protein
MVTTSRTQGHKGEKWLKFSHYVLHIHPALHLFLACRITATFYWGYNFANIVPVDLDGGFNKC